MVVALGARNQRAACQILVNERADYGVLESLLVVHHVVRHSQVLRHALGIVNIVERAAALSVGAVTVEFRQAALVPKLHRQTDNWKSALDQDRRDGRAVHAAAHGDGSQRTGLLFS